MKEDSEPNVNKFRTWLGHSWLVFDFGQHIPGQTALSLTSFCPLLKYLEQFLCTDICFPWVENGRNHIDYLYFYKNRSYQFSSVAQSCPTLCDTMDCSMLGFPVHHQLLQLTQTQRPLSWWCHPTISSSVVPFSSCLQSFPASGSFQMTQFFASGEGNGNPLQYSCLENPMDGGAW